MSPLASGESWSLPVAGQGGVPADAVGAVLNVTVTDTTSAGYLTLYPSGVPRPTASNLNWAAGETIPNLAEVKLGARGNVDLYNHAGQADVYRELRTVKGAGEATTSRMVAESSKPLTARTPIDTSREAVYHIPSYGSNIRKLVHDDKLQAQEIQQAITTPQERIVAAKQVKAIGSELAKARNAVKASPNDAAVSGSASRLEFG